MRDGGSEPTSIHWPFVGRAAERAAATAAVQQVQGLLVAGPAGMGKSSLVRAVLAEAGHTAQWCMASPATQRIPFGAVAGLLLFAGVEAPDPTRYLIAARAALATGGEPPLVVVDDAPLLDRASVVLLSQLFHEGRLRLVLTARDGQPLAEELARLVDDGAMAELRVAPLSPSECADAVEQALGGPVDPESASLLAERSAGNPLLLRELLLAGRAADVVAWRRGSWHLSGELPLSDRLIDVIARRLAAADVDVQRAVALVALGEPLPLAAAVDAAADTGLPLDTVEALGLVAVVQEPAGPMLQVAHPLVGEAVLRSTPTAVRRDLLAALVAAVHADTSTEPDVTIRWSVARLDVGLPVPQATLTRAAQHAFGFLDHPLAVRLAEAALAHGEHFESLLTLGAAHSAQLELEGGAAALERAVAAASDDHERARAYGRLGLHLAIRAARVEDAVKLLEHGLEQIADPEWKAFLTADLAKVQLSAGSTSLPIAPRSDRDDGTLSAVALANECIAEALISSLVGDAERTLRAAARGAELVDDVRAQLPNLGDLLALAAYLALGFAGRATEAAQLAATHIAAARSGRREPLGMWLAMQAATALHTGDPVTARTIAQQALPLVAEHDFVGGLAAQCAAVIATADAQTGAVGSAQQLIDGVDPMWRNDARVLLHLEMAQAWVLAANGRDAAAASRVLAAARHATANGLVMLAALAAHDSVRIRPSADATELLAELAEAAPSSLAPVLARAAVAQTDGNPHAADEAAAALELAGAVGRAADLYEAAATMHRRRSASAAATTAARRAAALRATLAPVTQGPLLGERERQIASLAAARWSNREIADALGVSIRTVENTLAKVFRKVDVARRSDLRARLDALGLYDPAAAGE